MKSVSYAVLGLLFCSSSVLAASAGSASSPIGAGKGATPAESYMEHGDIYKGLPARLHSPKSQALFDLREEGLKLQAADGGALTGPHRAYLQARLDAIQNGDYGY
jgi:hypothetical protein